MSEMTPGEYHFRENIQMLDPNIQRSEHLRMRAGERLMAEVVELMLALGSDSGRIFNAMCDALHNEAKKAEVYPSQIVCISTQESTRVEIVDVGVCLDYVRYLCAIDQKLIEHDMWVKLHSIHSRINSGEYKLVDGNLFKISSGR